MLVNVEQRLTLQIERASTSAVAPATDENLADPLEADNIEKVSRPGGRFHTGQIRIAPRFAPPKD